MAWEKSPPELAERFGSILDRFPAAERRKMFGYPAAFVAGNMVTGLHQGNWVVRLSEDEQERARGEGAVVFEPMPGRPTGTPPPATGTPPPATGPITADEAKAIGDILGKPAAPTPGAPTPTPPTGTPPPASGAPPSGGAPGGTPPSPDAPKGPGQPR